MALGYAPVPAIDARPLCGAEGLQWLTIVLYLIGFSVLTRNLLHHPRKLRPKCGILSFRRFAALMTLSTE